MVTIAFWRQDIPNFGAQCVTIHYKSLLRHSEEGRSILLDAGIFFWFLRKRDKRPQRYGPSRYGNEDLMQKPLPLNGMYQQKGGLPSSVDA